MKGEKKKKVQKNYPYNFGFFYCVDHMCEEQNELSLDLKCHYCDFNMHIWKSDNMVYYETH